MNWVCMHCEKWHFSKDLKEGEGVSHEDIWKRAGRLV